MALTDPTGWMDDLSVYMDDDARTAATRERIAGGNEGRRAGPGRHDQQIEAALAATAGALVDKRRV